MKVAINTCYGGFGLSDQAKDLYQELAGRPYSDWEDDSRTDPILIQVIEQLGKAANGDCADLEIVDIPDDIEWSIEYYDGIEHVAEAHRTWG